MPLYDDNRIEKSYDVDPYIIRPDGSLYDITGFVHWKVGEERIHLNGYFTVEKLKAYIEYMGNTEVKVKQ
jgi:hypothetical protein